MVLRLAFGRFVNKLEPHGLPDSPCVQEILKADSPVADGMRMFMPCRDEPEVLESEIAGFCAALNAPVLNIEMLEVGPARAGIMLATDERGALRLMVRVSLLSSGEGVTFKFQGDPSEFGDTAGAIEAALSFSEGMGFLFEEDLLSQGGPAGRSRAFKIWNSLCTGCEETRFEVDVPERDTAAPTVAPSPPPPEIELTSAVEDSLSPTQSQIEPSGEVKPEESAPAVASGAMVLTKFRERRQAERRKPADTQEARVPAARRSGSEVLARVAIESEQVGTKFVDDSEFLTRLLSSF